MLGAKPIHAESSLLFLNPCRAVYKFLLCKVKMCVHAGIALRKLPCYLNLSFFWCTYLTKNPHHPSILIKQSCPDNCAEEPPPAMPDKKEHVCRECWRCSRQIQQTEFLRLPTLDKAVCYVRECQACQVELWSHNSSILNYVRRGTTAQ